MFFKNEKDKIWLPVHTKPRSEKKLIQYCDKFSIKSYLPLKFSIEKKKQSLSRFTSPMFPGYCFVQYSAEIQTTLLQSHKIVQILKISPDLETELIEELNNLKIFEDALSERCVIVAPEIQVGASVEIKSGPLKGLEGVVNERKGKVKVFVNVNLIGQSVSAELDIEEIKIIV